MTDYRLPSRLLGVTEHKIAEFYFRTNDDQLDRSDLQLTGAIGAHLKTRVNRGEKVDLFFVGNCDRTGKAAYNQRLALRRAKSVRKSVVNAAGGWGQVMNTSLFEHNLIAARSLGEDQANQRATSMNELAVDRRVDVWQQKVSFKISIPQDVLDRRREVVKKILRMERRVEEAKQHAVMEGSKRYEPSQFNKDYKRTKETIEGARSMHPFERRHESRIKMMVIRELELVVDRCEFELNDLKAQLRMIDREIESYQ